MNPQVMTRGEKSTKNQTRSTNTKIEDQSKFKYSKASKPHARAMKRTVNLARMKMILENDEIIVKRWNMIKDDENHENDETG